MTRRVKVTGDLFHGQIPTGAIYVGRAAPGLRKSPYANPYPVKTYGLDESLRLYRQWLADSSIDPSALRGLDLACWCPLRKPCHADVLLELANYDPSPSSRQSPGKLAGMIFRPREPTTFRGETPILIREPL
jgi:Domain of unknown function (DUF4326)